MDQRLVVVAAGAALASAAHAWIGSRYFLPRLIALPAFAEKGTATPRARGWLRVAWYAGTFGILAWAAFLVNVESIVRHQLQWLFIYGSAILVALSPILVGSYLGLLLQSRARHLGMWFTFVVWAVLAVIVVATWRAADSATSRSVASPADRAVGQAR